MKTSDLVKVSAGKSIQHIVNYNLQDKKTTGYWHDKGTQFKNDEPLMQKDLLSFHNISNDMKATSIQKSYNFINQSEYEAKRYLNLHPRPFKNNRRLNKCQTIIQSFDYQANPKLNPQTVHQMGNSLYQRVQEYLQNKYHYRLDNGIVSTHIDDDKDKVNHHSKKIRVKHPHLHNHIIVPSFNDKGQSIAPYVRKSNLYHFQYLNDEIGSNYNLNDYYFNKLHRQIDPASAYTESRKKKRYSTSNLQRAWRTFKEANDYAWDKNKPMRKNNISAKAFKKTKHDRDDYLQVHFDFRTKTVKDRETGKKRKVFNLANLKPNKNMQAQWYSIKNLRILQWRNEEDMQTERLLWQFSFKGLLNKSTSFKEYQDTINYATQKLPDVSKIVKPSLRQKFQIKLASAYRHVKKVPQKAKKHINDARIKIDQKYGKYIFQRFHLLRSKIIHKKHMGTSNFLVTGVANSINSAYKKHVAKKQQNHQSTVQANRSRERLQRNQQKSVQQKQNKQHRYHQGSDLEL